MFYDKDLGKLIVFEGIDGSGTTSQAKELQKRLIDKQKEKVYFTKEPSDGHIGSLLRTFLKNTSCDIDRTSMCLLFVADRIQHTKDEILPNLKNGETVICDRYIWSTWAYQSIYFGQDWITELHRYDYIDMPALTILLDCELNIAETRRQSRSDSVERYDDMEIQARVKDNYLGIAKKFTDRSVVIDANKDFNTVADKIYETVVKRCFNEPQSNRAGNRVGKAK